MAKASRKPREWAHFREDCIPFPGRVVQRRNHYPLQNRRRERRAKTRCLKMFFFSARKQWPQFCIFFEGRGGGQSSWIFWASCIFNRDNLAADDLARGGSHWSLVLFSAVRVAKFEIPPLVLSRCEIPSWIRGRIEFGSLCSCKKPNINNTTTTNSNGPILDRRPIPIAYSHFLSDLRETRDGVVGRLGGNYRRLPPPPPP